MKGGPARKKALSAKRCSEIVKKAAKVRRLKRSMRRSWTKEVVCGGNTETFWQNFATRDSALLEILQRRKRYASIAEAVSVMAPPGLDFFHIQTARQLDEFYEAQGLTRYSPVTAAEKETARGA